jgi:hypothetical protein
MNTPEYIQFKSRAGNYAVFGILFGLLFPILGSILALQERSIPLSVGALIGLHSSSQMMWILDAVPLFLGIVFHIAGRNEDSSLNIQVNLSRLITQKMSEVQHSHQIQRRLNSLLSTALEGLPLQEQLEQSLEIILSCPQLGILRMGGIFLVDENQPGILKPSVHQNMDTAMLRNFHGHIDEGYGKQLDGLQLDEHYEIPIMLGKEVLGVMVLYPKAGHVLNPGETAFLQAAANALAGMIQRKRLEKHIHLQGLALETTEM